MNAGPIPYARQDVRAEDVAAVIEILGSDYLTQGPAVPRFETAVAEYCGAKHAIAVNSATSALHIGCLSLGVGPGDRVWTTPNTFVASANCALHCGAAIDFVDIDARSCNMSVGALAEKLERAAQNDALPKVVIPVHFGGQSCDMAAIHALARKYGFRILEDASHAIGGKYRHEAVGSCRFSDIAVFSFHPVKIITTGEGGMALTNDGALAARMACLRTHGVTRDAALMHGHVEGPWYYEQIDLGFNYRMTDIQAALGNSQLGRIDEYVARRRALADRYDGLLEDLPLVTPWRLPDADSAWHLYVVRVAAGRDRNAVYARLRSEGIGVNVHYIPVHTQPYYRRLGFERGDYPESEKHYAQAISLPMYATLTESQQDRVANALRNALQ